MHTIVQQINSSNSNNNNNSYNNKIRIFNFEINS